MSDDFSQMESHVESAVCGLRTVQGAGKYPKKVCIAAMYGANMLNAQKGAISNLRHDNDRMVEEIAELKGALKINKKAFLNLIELDLVPDSAKQETLELADSIYRLLAKLNQEGEE